MYRFELEISTLESKGGSNLTDRLWIAKEKKHLIGSFYCLGWVTLQTEAITFAVSSITLKLNL
jgi:hypothetical protein